MKKILSDIWVNGKNIFQKNRFYSWLIIAGIFLIFILNIFFNIIGYLMTVIAIVFLFMFSKKVSSEEPDIFLLDKNAQRKELENRLRALEEQLILTPQNKELMDELTAVKRLLK